MLPTLDVLHSRYPEYITNTNCFFCQQYHESSEQLTTCNGLIEKWKHIIEVTTNKIIDKAKAKWDISLPYQAIHNLFRDDLATLIKGNSNIIAWLKGIIPIAAINIL